MKATPKFLFLLLCSFLFASAQAQLTDKDVDHNGTYKAKKFKDAPKRLYINSFNVYFEVFGTARASTTGGEWMGTLKGNTNVAMGIALDGVNSADFQEITDAAYAHFVSQLEEMGYEIISADEAGKTSALSEWQRKEGGELSSTQTPGFLRATPTNYSYFVKRETKKGKERSGFFDNKHLISKDLGDAVVVDANFNFYFVQMKTYSNEFIGYSQVKGKPNFHMARMRPGSATDQTLTTIAFAFGKNLTAAEAGISTTLKKGHWSDKPVFKDEKVKESAAADSKAIPDYAQVIFVNNTNMQVSHYFEADRALYMGETQRMLKQFIDLGVGKLRENL